MLVLSYNNNFNQRIEDLISDLVIPSDIEKIYREGVNKIYEYLTNKNTFFDNSLYYINNNNPNATSRSHERLVC